MPSLLAFTNGADTTGIMPPKRSISNWSANEPFIKRRKTTTGLNSRFDRMIETVNILHTSPASSKSSRSGGRLRAASSSSASAVEFEMPRTPVDAYSEPHGRRLGADFMVMKMRGRESSGDLGFSANCGRYAHEEPSSCNSLSIPAWLSNTLSTLDTHHPLRRLMHVGSTSHDAAPAATLGLPVELVDMPRHAQPAEQVVDHDSIFAFNPPGGPVTELKARTTVPWPPASAELAASTERDISLLGNVDMPFVPSHCSPIPDGKVFEDSPLVPFSTPGPASSVSAVPPSMFPLESVRRSTTSFLVSLHANLAEQNGHEQHDHAFAAITNSSNSIASGQPALLKVTTADTGGDFFGGPLGDNEDPRLSIPAQLSGPRHIPRIHPTAPECHDYMRAVGGSVNQISSSSPTLEDEVLPSVWRSATNTGRDPSPIQRTTESNALQAWAERRDLLHTPGPVNVTPIRSTSTRPVRIYFDSDSPADDTYYSDALDPESHVPPEDLASLDFKWEKFDRGHVGKTHTSDPSEFGIDLSLGIPTPRTLSAPDLQSVPRTPVLVTACSSPSSGTPVLRKESPEDHNDNGTWIVPTAAALSGASYPSRGHRAAHAAESAFRPLQSVFAPAPGIFLSPLRKTGEDDDNPSPKPRRRAGGGLQTPVRDPNSLQSSPCERTQRRIRALHGQTPTASEQPVALAVRDADIERGVPRPSPNDKTPGRSPSIPATPSEPDGIAAAATEGGRDLETIQQDVSDDVSDDGHTSACSQESHDTIELWSE